MSYVDKNLMDGEQIIYRTQIHWLIFLPAAAWLVLGLVLAGAGHRDQLWLGIGALGVLLALYYFFRAFIQRLSTELAVTSKRVILKTGLIRRDTLELNHSKVESFHVEQGILGRLFDFGTLIINGTGGGKTPIRNIEAPLEFRKKAMTAIDASQVR
jgi:uncharacterized membrane protein YdbT with pleckstrin-like domain